MHSHMCHDAHTQYPYSCAPLHHDQALTAREEAIGALQTHINLLEQQTRSLQAEIQEKDATLEEARMQMQETQRQSDEKVSYELHCTHSYVQISTLKQTQMQKSERQFRRERCMAYMHLCISLDRRKTGGQRTVRTACATYSATHACTNAYT